MDEACFYECDHNIGKFRKYPQCFEANGDPNAWQIVNLPIKASYCDAWYNACQNDKFCTDGVTNSYFSVPETVCAGANCKTFKQIYGSGQAMCEVMWAGSFKYSTNEANAFTMSFDPNAPVSPNDVVGNQYPEPQFCPFRAPFVAATECAKGKAQVAVDATTFGPRYNSFFGVSAATMAGTAAAGAVAMAVIGALMHVL